MDYVKLFQASTDVANIMDKAADELLPKEIVDIVKFHSKGAAVAAMAAGLIPAAGAAAAIVTSAGFVWTMYGRINKRIGLSLTDSVMKSLASGVATNLATGAATAFVISTATSLFPFMGSIASSVVIGGTCYALTLTAGYVYLKLLVNLFKAGKDPSSMTAESLRKAAKTVVENEDIKGVMKEAKEMYKKARERGEITEQPKSSDSEEHVFNEKGVCVVCGCTEGFVKKFGLKCKNEDKIERKKCEKCKTEVPVEAAFCPECGTKIPKKCTKCQTEVPVEAAFCPECGIRISDITQ